MLAYQQRLHLAVSHRVRHTYPAGMGTDLQIAAVHGLQLPSGSFPTLSGIVCICCTRILCILVLRQSEILCFNFSPRSTAANSSGNFEFHIATRIAMPYAEDHLSSKTSLCITQSIPMKTETMIPGAGEPQRSVSCRK